MYVSKDLMWWRESEKTCNLNEALVTENNKVKAHWNDSHQFIINLWNKILFYSFMQSMDPIYTTAIQAYQCCQPNQTIQWDDYKHEHLLCAKFSVPVNYVNQQKPYQRNIIGWILGKNKWNNLIWNGKREQDTPGPTLFGPDHLNKVQR